MMSIYDRSMEMIHSINANSLESYIVMLMHSGCHEEMISDFVTNNSYWESHHYCMQVMLLYE